MAVVAEQHQPVGHRHSDERADQQRLVDHRPHAVAHDLKLPPGNKAFINFSL
jgi:hypothetical protein